MPEEEKYTIQSPLKKWPGRVELVHPDQFRGTHWNMWRQCVSGHERHETINRLMGYAGLEFIERSAGTWAVDGLPLAEVKSWETKPDEEVIKVISWLGREFQEYIRAVTDPKE